MSATLQAGPAGPAFSLRRPLLLSLAVHGALVAWLATAGWQGWQAARAGLAGAVPTPSTRSLLLNLHPQSGQDAPASPPGPASRIRPAEPRAAAPVQFDRAQGQDAGPERALLTGAAPPPEAASEHAAIADPGLDVAGGSPAAVPPAPAIPAGLAFRMPLFGGGRGLFQPPMGGPSWEATREEMIRQQAEQARQAAWSEGLRQLHAQLVRQLPAGSRLDCRFDTAWTCQGPGAHQLQAFNALAQPLRQLRPELALTLRRESDRLELGSEPATGR